MATNDLKQFLEDVDDKNLECTICLKRLNNPKLLDCFHSFCLSCLEELEKKNEGNLTCPTCSKSYPIPESGLQKLPPNTFIDNLLETIEQFAKREQMKCYCGTEKEVKYYCQECRQYLCSTCSDDHKKFRIMATHKLHTAEEVRSMTSQRFASLNQPLCSFHKEPLKFYCMECKIPICTDCIILEHKELEGSHKAISISEAFQIFKETSEGLQEAVHHSKETLQDGLDAVIENTTKLEENKDTSLRDIDNQVQEMVKIIKDNGEKLKNNVQAIYRTKRKANDEQMYKLKTRISDVNRNLSFANQLFKSNEATAMQSSETVLTALKGSINDLPNTEPNDNGQIYFLKNKEQSDSLQQCDIGSVTQVKANSLILTGPESVTQGQTIVVRIIKTTDEYEMDANQLEATWTQPTGEINITKVEEDDDGEYIVTGKCPSQGDCIIDVNAANKSIKQSIITIKVEKEGLVNSIKINTEGVRGVVKCEGDCLLVSFRTNEIYNYKQTGEYVGKVTLPENVKVYRMYKMKNGNIVFSDFDNQCIKVCDMNGQVINTFGEGVLESPRGIHVDEESNVVYVAEGGIESVIVFDVDSGEELQRICSPVTADDSKTAFQDVTFTQGGNMLVTVHSKSQILLFDKERFFLKVLINSGDEDGKLMYPHGVVVDEDDNIIVGSKDELQLFSKDGNFIKQIGKKEDGINSTWQLCIISYHPRRVAVANGGDGTIKIFNY